MKYVSLVALGALFLASSGLTVILHDCVMMKAEVDCCVPVTMSTTSDTCSGDRSSIVESAIGSAQSCHTNTIIGGLGVRQALIQKVNLPDEATLGLSEPVWASDLSQYVSSNVSLRTFEVGNSPPAAYLLNGSLLI